jgi:hypothetical protein
MVVSVGTGAAVVGGGAGAVVVVTGAGLLVVGAGAAVVGAAVVGAAVVGAAVVGAAAVGAWVAAVVGADTAAPPGFGTPHVTLYAAGLERAMAGLVTTSTTFPVCGTHAWNVSGFAACVPGRLKISWTGVVFSPLDIAQ